MSLSDPPHGVPVPPVLGTGTGPRASEPGRTRLFSFNHPGTLSQRGRGLHAGLSPVLLVPPGGASPRISVLGGSDPTPSTTAWPYSLLPRSRWVAVGKPRLGSVTWVPPQCLSYICGQSSGRGTTSQTAASWGEQVPGTGLLKNNGELRGFPGGAVVKNLVAKVGDGRDAGLIAGWEGPLEKEIAAPFSPLA